MDTTRVPKLFDRLGRRALTRREILVGGVILAEWIAIPHSTHANSQPDPPIVAGIVDRVDPSNNLTVLSHSGEKWNVRLIETTMCRRHGDLAEPTAFIPGDEVVAEGRWASGTLIANSCDTLYHTIEGQVLQVEAHQVETTDGTFSLTRETQPWSRENEYTRPLTDLVVGEEIMSLVWRDPHNSHRLVAAAVAISQESSWQSPPVIGYM